MMKISNVNHTEETDSASAQGRSDPTRRILVVEDESDIRSFNAEVLRRTGYQVDTAADGEAGWKALHAVGYDPDSYDLVITDNDMPKVSGVELLKKLRAARIVIPVIMATGTLPVQEPTQSPWLQPAAILLKPYRAEELLSTVRQVLRASESPWQPIAPSPDWGRRPSVVGWQL